MNSRPCIRQRIRNACLPSKGYGSPVPLYYPIILRGLCGFLPIILLRPAQVIYPSNRTKIMARPQRKRPKPNLRLRDGCYELRWYAQGKHFEIRLGAIRKHNAEIIRDATAVTLAWSTDFPDEIRAEPTLKRYLALMAGIEKDTADDVLINNYVTHLRSQIPDSQWPTIVNYNLKRALKNMGTLQHATPKDLQNFLDALAVETSGGKSNRSRTGLSGFTHTYMQWASIL